MRLLTLTLCLFFITNILHAQNNNSDDEKNWPHWRGPYANGISLNGNPPLEWSEEKNIKWKVAIPGLGHSTPIIWGDQLFVSTAISVEAKEDREEQPQQDQRGWMRSKQTKNIYKFVVFSFDRQNGKVIWQTTVKEEIPKESTHEFGSWASNSPLTDGKHIYAYFGSRGIFCLDMKGKLQWERDFGQMEKHMEFGEGSSPALYDDKIFVLWDHNGDSFLFALDVNTGKDVWKVVRDEETSWSTPFIVKVKEKPQVITNATNRIRSYDFSTGDLIWECSGMTRNVIPMPVVSDNLIFIMSGFRGSALLAIDLTKAKGDITGTDAIVWQYNKDTSYTPSPLLLDNYLYFLRVNSGALTCLDAKTGKVNYSRERLEGAGNLFTSPVGLKDKIYILGGSGITYVIKPGPEFKLLAQNKLDDGFHASPVIHENNLYLRGFKHLYCIEEN